MGLKYTVDRDKDTIVFAPIKVPPPPNVSPEARALLARINPEWSVERQLYVEENLTFENMAELLGW